MPQQPTFYRERSTVLPRRWFVFQQTVYLACGHFKEGVDSDGKVLQHDPAWCDHCRKLTMVVWAK